MARHVAARLLRLSASNGKSTGPDRATSAYRALVRMRQIICAGAANTAIACHVLLTCVAGPSEIGIGNIPPHSDGAATSCRGPGGAGPGRAGPGEVEWPARMYDTYNRTEQVPRIKRKPHVRVHTSAVLMESPSGLPSKVTKAISSSKSNSLQAPKIGGSPSLGSCCPIKGSMQETSGIKT